MADTSSTAENQAFLRAYDEYGDAIFRFCIMKVSSREVALDLTQETFTKTWEYISRGGVIENWRAFLYRSANNLIIDHYRKHKSASLEDMHESTGFVPADEHLDSEQLAQVQEAHRAIAALPEEYRTIVALRFIDGLNPKEIAAIVELSSNVVSVRLHRGIAKLRDILNGASAL